ncbi:MAG: 23S rRNA (adenine(2503)-C(2))-methyltransferase RlmN, partial [Verrucomicrobiota bacterium]
MDIKSQTQEELVARFKAWGEHSYLVPQLLNWLYVRRVTTLDEMTNLPKALLEKL